MLCNISQNAMRQPPGGVPISHNALQHFPECHGAATGGGVPCQVQLGGGYPARSSWAGGYPGGGYPAGGYPGQGTPPPWPGQPGGVPDGGVPRSGTPPTWPGGVPRSGTPPARLGGVPRSGQHREYLPQGGRYASCVHEGGLSCS